ncbi:PAS domain S-box protein, partial [Myxococcota bacterium]|nr:PAS domain S-box protein [Myxococcota bacterium]
MSNLKIRYAIIGMMTVPWIGFVALYNAGLHQHYIRYLLPMFVGALSGYLIGLMKTRFLEKKAGLEAAIIALKEENKGRKRAEEELRTDKELLAVTLRSLGEGVVSVNPEGEITLFNKTAEKITGVSSSKAIGKPVEEVISLIDHDNREEARNPIRCGLQGQSHCSTDPNTLLISQEGREYYIEDNGLPIYDALHEVVGAVWVFRDVSEKRKAEAELFKARQLDSLGVLAGGIAHDFNNLLVGVMGNISLASHLLKEQDEARLLLDEAQKASTQAGALARQLLTFSRGGEPVKEVRSIVDILKKSAHSVLKDSSVSLKLDAAEDLKHVDIDKGQIAQVIQNLVLNAVEAIEGAGTIQISCQNVD